jgi:uncharacterized membrane protein
MSDVVRHARGALFVALAVGYALLAHYTNIADGAHSLGSVVALAPIMLALLSLAWNARFRRTMLAAFGALCVALFLQWDRITPHYGQLYWLEHAGTMSVLGLSFARTLRHGREPMCTYFARIVHGGMSPALAHYTRQVTRVWSVFFGLVALTSTLLFFTMPLHVWSAFANFFTAPLIGGMFAVEYLVRHRALPGMKHAPIIDGIKAFWKTPAG